MERKSKQAQAVEESLLKLSEYIHTKQYVRNELGYLVLDKENRPIKQITGENPEIAAIYNALSAMYEYVASVEKLTYSLCW